MFCLYILFVLGFYDLIVTIMKYFPYTKILILEFICTYVDICITFSISHITLACDFGN